MVDYLQYIEINPEKRFGRPLLKGTRISVYDVLNWLANDMSKKQILSDFPELSEDMINACLFYAANKENHLRIASWNSFFDQNIFQSVIASQDALGEAKQSHPDFSSGLRDCFWHETRHRNDGKKEFYSWKYTLFTLLEIPVKTS